MAYCQHHQTHNCACAKEHTEAQDRYDRAKKAFDTISGAMYRGFWFRELLASNPDMLETAEKFAGFFKEKSE